MRLRVWSLLLGGSLFSCSSTFRGFDWLVRIPRVEHHTRCIARCMRAPWRKYTISENDMLETTILTSTNTTGTLTRDDLDQPGTTYSTYPVLSPFQHKLPVGACSGFASLWAKAALSAFWKKPVKLKRRLSPTKSRLFPTGFADMLAIIALLHRNGIS